MATNYNYKLMHPQISFALGPRRGLRVCEVVRTHLHTILKTAAKV